MTNHNGERASDVTVDRVSLSYGTKGEGDARVLTDFSLDIPTSSFTCLIGPSGCGKSSLLKAIAGLVPIQSGSILVGGERVTGPGSHLGMVFQEFALFPWLTVAQNIGFGDRFKGLGKTEKREVIDHYLEMIGLIAFRSFYPSRLSGGMRQRVALARAWANQPAVMLMDEPFGALDARTRTELQAELLSIWLAERHTIVFVTHDTYEAAFLADRIVAMNRSGEISGIVDVDLPRPRMRTSADFVDVLTRVDTLAWAKEAPHAAP